MKKIRVTIIVVACVLLVVLGGIFYLNNISFANKLNVEQAQTPVADIVLNDPQLIQIGDKLYYGADSYNNPVLYGIYEIQSGRTKRIWWDGIASPLNMNAGQSFLFEHDGKLAVYDEEHTYVYDRESKDFISGNDYKHKYSDLAKSIKNLTDRNVQPEELCVFNNKVYYACEDSNLILCLYEFDPDKNTETALCNTSKETSAIKSYLYVCDDCIYLEYSNYASEVLCIRYDPASGETILLSKEDYRGIPFTHEVGVLCEYDKIYSVDRKSGEKTLVAESDSMITAFLFDRNWIYYSPTNNSLWRVSLDGTTREKVF